MKTFLNVWKKINKEIVAGLTTFFTMSYIVIVNPLIWSTPGTGVSLSFALTATVLVLVIINLLAGFVIKLPYAFGPGMGLNAFVVYTMILSQGIPFPTALGVMFWSSVLFMLISIFPVRQKIIEALPENMKHAMCCGVGLFLAFIGFKNLNLIVSSPSTLLQIGHLNVKIFLGLIGFCLAFYFFIKKKSYAFLVSIVIVTILAILTKQALFPEKIFSIPNVSGVFRHVDIFGALKLSLIPTMLALLMTNLFDSISTIIALSHSSGLQDAKGHPLQLKKTLFIDSFGSLFSSLVGTSPTAVYIESAAGIQAGGRTGIVPIVVALCFLPCLFFEPVIRIIPAFATAPILIFVGILMSLHLKYIRVENFDDIAPVFLTIFLMPLTSSITYGVVFGIISYVVMKVLAGKYKEVSYTLWIIAIVSGFVFLTSFTNKTFEINFKEACLNAKKHSTLSVNFKQEFYSALREKTTVSTGELFLKGKLFRWEIKEPRKQLYVNDGHFVWKFEPEFNHVEKFDLSASDDFYFINLLNDIKSIEKYYKVSEGKNSNSKKDILNIILEPKNENQDQRSLDLLIEIKTGYVTELNMSDSNGNKTKFYFDNFSNKNIKQEQFVFIVPKGVKIDTFKQ